MERASSASAASNLHENCGLSMATKIRPMNNTYLSPNASRPSNQGCPSYRQWRQTERHASGVHIGIVSLDSDCKLSRFRNRGWHREPTTKNVFNTLAANISRFQLWNE
jgi:hypothetical protein